MTLAERFIVAFRLPYPVGCVVVGFFLFGFLDPVFSRFVSTGDLSGAIGAAISLPNLSVDVLVAYSFYAVRYMRQKLVQAGRSLSALLPTGEVEHNRIFARVAAPKPQIATWTVFLATLLMAVNTPAILGTGSSTIVFNAGPSSALEVIAALYDIASIAVLTLALSSVVWAFASISLGIHRFGGASLRLRPYYEDPFLGLKPVGSLAFSLAIAYFGFIGLFLLGVLSSTTTPETADLIGVGGFLSGLIVLGLVLFFLPLNRLHRRMSEQKQIERSWLREKIVPIFQEPVQGNPGADIGHMFRLDMMERKVTAMANWPFDMRILGKLSVIALSLTAILLSRIIALILKI